MSPFARFTILLGLVATGLHFAKGVFALGLLCLSLTCIARAISIGEPSSNGHH